jgi:beta-lactamase regulating signal transducer with metallopeptidase domain
MNIPADWLPCLRLAALIAIEAAFLFGLGLIVERLVPTGRLQRTVWQTVVLTALLVTLVELSGLSREVTTWFQPHRHTARASSPASGLPSGVIPPISRVTEDFRTQVAGRLALLQVSESTAVQQLAGTRRQEPPVEPYLEGPVWPWPELVWWIGFAACLGPVWLGHFCVFAFRRLHGKPADSRLQQRVASLSQRVGVSGPVRLFATRWLRVPAALGLWRPSIGVPLGFDRAFTPEQQEVMLAHELAHLASRDPFWQSLADLLSALLWWHPLAWLARQRLRAAAETAADEASTVVADGPGLLAECLVRLATQVDPPQLNAGLGILGGGFRSSLGKRVEKLVHFKGAPWSPRKSRRARAAQSFAVPVLLLILLVTAAWFNPQRNELPMNSLAQTWRKSLATLALFTVANAQPSPTQRTEAAEPPEPASQKASEAAQANTPAVQNQPGTDGIHQATLVQDAKLLIELGKLDEAEAKLKEALKVSPDNRAAIFYLDLISKQRAEETNRQLTARYGMAKFSATQTGNPGNVAASEVDRYRMDPRLAARYGLLPQTPQTAHPAQASAKHLSQGKQQIENKLSQIVLTEVAYDGVPLSDVVRDLNEAAIQHDPENLGINFLISSLGEGARSSGVDPATGQPIPVQSPDLGTVTIHLRLRNVRLKDVIDAITKVAEQPLHYDVEDYGVVFSAGLAPARPATSVVSSQATDLSRLRVRTFRVDTNTLVAGLESAFRISLPRHQDRPKQDAEEQDAAAKVAQAELALKRLEKLSDHLVAPQDLKNAKSDVDTAKAEYEAVKAKAATASDSSRAVQQALRGLFQQLGVNMDAPDKAVYYNGLTGIVMVQATAHDLDLIEAAIDTLGGELLHNRDAHANLEPHGARLNPVPVLGDVPVLGRLFRTEENLDPAPSGTLAP